MTELQRNKLKAQRQTNPQKKRKKQPSRQAIQKKRSQKRPVSKKKIVNTREKSRKQPVRKRKRPNPVLSALSSIIFYGLVTCIVIGSLLFAVSKSSDKSIFGYQFYDVLTDSMVAKEGGEKGGFHAGDMIIVKKISGDRAEVGDIITFRPSMDSKIFLTHRVKEKMDHLGTSKGTYYITQGDANVSEDVPIHSEQVVGKKVAVIPKVSAVLTFIRDHIVVSVIFCLSVFGFVTVVRYYILNK